MRQLNDNQELIFTELNEIQDFFKNQYSGDNWRRPYIREMKLVAIDNVPILLKTTKEKYRLENYSDEVILETMQGTGLLLSCPGDSKAINIPIRDTSFVSLCDRAGLNGRALTRSYKSNKVALTRMLNQGFQLWEKNAQILIRDEKVSAVHSQEYVVLPTIQLLNCLVDTLNSMFSGWILKQGATSHSSTSVVIDLSCKKHELLSTLNRTLKRANVRAIDGMPELLFTTSDTASSGANLYPYIKMDGLSVRIGDPLVLRHDGKNSLVEFEGNTKKIFSLFKDATKKLEELATIKIAYPVDCMLAIANKLGLPRQASLKAAEDFDLSVPLSATALDVYWALWTIPTIMQAKTVESAINNEETVSRAIAMNFKNFDSRYRWE